MATKPTEQLATEQAKSPAAPHAPDTGWMANWGSAYGPVDASAALPMAWDYELKATEVSRG